MVGSSCWELLFAAENCVFLGKQLFGFPVGCALAVSLDGFIPPDLPPNSLCSEGPELGQGSWEKIAIIYMDSLRAQESGPRIPPDQVHWKHGGMTVLPERCRCKMGLAGGYGGTARSPPDPQVRATSRAAW